MDKFVYNRLSSDKYYYVKNGKPVFNMTDREESKLQRWKLTNYHDNSVLSTNYEQWASMNGVKYYNSYEWDNLTVHTERLGIRFKKEDVTLPTEYIRKVYMGNIIHHSMSHPRRTSTSSSSGTAVPISRFMRTSSIP